MAWKLAVLLSLLAASPVGAEYLRRDDDEARFQAYREQAQREARLHPELQIPAAMRWGRDGFGTVLMVGQIALRNDNEFAVKDLRMICRGYGNSGTEIEAKRWIIYERLEPRQYREIQTRFNLGFLDPQVTSLTCGVESATVID